MHGNRYEDELKVVQPPPASPYLFGLYTSPANSVYVPRALIKPTDFSLRLRNLLLRRASDLYGDMCELLPSWLSIPLEDDPAWATDEFNWAETVGDCSNIGRFLEFRNSRIDELFGR